MTGRNHPEERKQAALLALRVTPRASRNEIVDVMSDGTVKIHLTAVPVEGKANESLLKFLAKVLDVSISQLTIVAGTGGRDKLVSVRDMDPGELQTRITNKIRR